MKHLEESRQALAQTNTRWRYISILHLLVTSPQLCDWRCWQKSVWPWQSKAVIEEETQVYLCATEEALRKWDTSKYVCQSTVCIPWTSDPERAPVTVRLPTVWGGIKPVYLDFRLRVVFKSITTFWLTDLGTFSLSMSSFIFKIKFATVSTIEVSYEN